MTTTLAIDVDRWACQTFRANFPDTEVRQACVADEIANLRQGEADILTGGFPCQPHSLAGKREASNDVRDCGPDFVAAIAKVQPRQFLGENVAGILSSENGRYVARLLRSMEEAGYVVEIRSLDAVSFGVPQFRMRVWFWGIRRDLHAAGMRHRWPKPTHTWPPPEECMFGAALLPGVTVGQALDIAGTLILEPHGNYLGGSMSAETPSPTMRSGSLPGCSDILLSSKQQCSTTLAQDSRHALMIQSHADPAGTIDAPAPALRSGGAGHDGCCLRIIGGKRAGGPGHDVDDRDITAEPAQTVGDLSHGLRNGEPRAVIYRWSDAMLQKHPPASPASPASPAPTVQAKWFKGGAEGLVQWKQTKDGLWVRRLHPFECARLQSMPEDFVWPEGISKTAMYRIIGNGQASKHVAAIADCMMAVDPEAKELISLFCGGGLGDCGWHGRFWSYERDLLGREAA